MIKRNFMKKIIRLTEKELRRTIKKMINEQELGMGREHEKTDKFAYLMENIVREKVTTLLTDFIEHDTYGNDFTNDIREELRMKVTELDERSVDLDMDLFDKFIDNVTAHISSGLIVEH
jgi:DNA mismatch repair ATPase MutS